MRADEGLTQGSSSRVEEVRFWMDTHTHIYLEVQPRISDVLNGECVRKGISDNSKTLREEKVRSEGQELFGMWQETRETFRLGVRAPEGEFSLAWVVWRASLGTLGLAFLLLPASALPYGRRRLSQ